MDKPVMFSGLALMVAVAILLLIGPDFGIQGWVGLTLLFLIGFCMVVAGAGDPNKKKEPGVDRPFGIDREN